MPSCLKHWTTITTYLHLTERQVAAHTPVPKQQRNAVKLLGVGYVFFQLRVSPDFREQPDYLDKRRSLLEIACGAAKNKFSHLTKVIGIGMDAPKFAGKTNFEDIILLPCEDWSNEMSAYYEEENQEWNFFGTSQLKKYNEHVTQFVPPNTITDSSSGKVGRNKPCPCGSGKKYKKCHGV